MRRLRTSHVWLFAFIYAAALSLIFQKLVLPMLPALHAGQGLMKNDAFLYHQAALTLAENIREHGWSAWSPWSSQTSTSGNVAVLSALYALFSPTPALIIPVNAVLHATSAAMLVLIGRELFPGRAGNLAGLTAAGLFVFFPSALSWYSQPLKDSYVIAGTLLVFYSWVMALRPMPWRRGLLAPLAWMAAGVSLIVFVKPYYLKLLLVALLLVAFVSAVQLFLEKHPQRIRILAFHLLAGSLLVAGMAAVKPYLNQTISGETYAKAETETGAGAGAGAG